MNLLKDENILALGMISMSLGILIGRFTYFEYLGFGISNFLEGVLTGLSLALNITYMIKKRSKK
jgi:hypothetical protein